MRPCALAVGLGVVPGIVDAGPHDEGFRSKARDPARQPVQDLSGVEARDAGVDDGIEARLRGVEFRLQARRVAVGFGNAGAVGVRVADAEDEMTPAACCKLAAAVTRERGKLERDFCAGQCQRGGEKAARRPSPAAS